MSKQFKHILVLFIEVINLHSVRAGDTKGSVDKRQNSLISQVQSLANQVMKFDPINYIKNAEQQTEQLIDAPDEEMIKDFTDKVLGGILARKSVPRQFVGQRLRHRHSMTRTNHTLNQSMDFKSMDNSSKYKIMQNFPQSTKYIVQKSTSPTN